VGEDEEELLDLVLGTLEGLLHGRLHDGKLRWKRVMKY
jgi:hypothetical protein